LPPFASFHPVGRPTEAVLSTVVAVLSVFVAASVFDADESTALQIAREAKAHVRTVF
jgi:hypothetical protein